jgi:catechol-2,3-dioxygenase
MNLSHQDGCGGGAVADWKWVAAAQEDYFANWPAGSSPQEVGIRIAVPDVAAAEKFYKAGLGFDEEALKSGLRMQISSETHQWVELNRAKVNREPEFAVK